MQCLLLVIHDLQRQGFTEHIYLTPFGWSCKGKLVNDPQATIHAFWHDENDLRVYVYSITSGCGSIRGVGII